MCTKASPRDGMEGTSSGQKVAKLGTKVTVVLSKVRGEKRSQA